MQAPIKRKVLYVITKSNWGGAQRYVYDLATHLPKDHFDVAVALGGSGEFKKRLEDSLIEVIQLDRLERDLSVGRDLAGFSSLFRVIRSYKPDIVHLNSSKAGGLGALAARVLGVKRIVFTAHGWPFEEKRSVFWRSFAFLGSWITALLSDIVIVVSKHDVQIGKHLPLCTHKIHLVHNGIEPLSLGSGEQIRAAFPAGVQITGTIGELTYNKNQIALIEQARENEKVYVAIVGEGELQHWLEEKIKEYGLERRVKLFGFIPAEEVLRGFDTFSLPSLKEGLPYVLLEAKAAGLSIVANRVGGVGDILDAPDINDFSLERMIRKTIALY